MPYVFSRLATDAAERAGFPGFARDACLINRYVPGARLTLQRGISASPSCPCRWDCPPFSCGVARPGPSGHAACRWCTGTVVWGGPARKTFHGVLELAPGQHRLTGPVRYNLTFRKAL
jgi:alkylated DNA repair protein (DNA oxidative demethylase)